MFKKLGCIDTQFFEMQKSFSTGVEQLYLFCVPVLKV